jgi:hypothetical protein
MKDLGIESIPARGRSLNAVALQNAVLCAECDVVSDSPHDICMVCGSRSLFNLARVFGGKLPEHRASLLRGESSSDTVVVFPKPHRMRERPVVGQRQLTVLSLDGVEANECETGASVGPNGG